MKSLTRFLAAAILVASTVGLRANPPIQPGASRPSQTGYVLKRIPFSAVHHGQAGLPRMRLWESTSENWSGYAVPLDTSGVNDTFSDVQGTWAVPVVTGAGGSGYSATWIGIDGYNDDTVEQIGSEQDWTGKDQQNYVWFEMYPNYAYEIEGFPADAGDSISAQVQYMESSTPEGPGKNPPGGRGKSAHPPVVKGKSTGTGVFQLTIKNITKGVSYTVPTSYTTLASAERSSAEWVVEAPWAQNVLPLADFGTTTFSGCSATSTGSGGVSKAISFWPDDPMTMIDPSGGEATPSSLFDDGTAFSVSWSP